MSKRVSLNVSLTPELASFVIGKVDSGRYGSASEVVRTGLRLLEAHDQTPDPHPSDPAAADLGDARHGA